MATEIAISGTPSMAGISPDQIVTREDLQNFKTELLSELQTLMEESVPANKQWLKSSEVRKMLSISHGSLQNLRVNGFLPYSKIQGTIYYDYQDILNMIEQNKRHHAQ